MPAVETMTKLIAIGVVLTLSAGCYGMAPPFSDEARRQAADRERQRQEREREREQRAIENAIQVSAADLVAAYGANEVAADDYFRGRLIRVTGPVSSIGETLGTMSVSLGRTFSSIQCMMLDEERQNVARLRQGQVVTLVGTGAGAFLGPVVRQCRVLEPNRVVSDSEFVPVPD